MIWLLLSALLSLHGVRFGDVSCRRAAVAHGLPPTTTTRSHRVVPTSYRRSWTVQRPVAATRRRSCPSNRSHHGCSSRNRTGGPQTLLPDKGLHWPSYRSHCPCSNSQRRNLSRSTPCGHHRSDERPYRDKLSFWQKFLLHPHDEPSEFRLTLAHRGFSVHAGSCPQNATMVQKRSPALPSCSLSEPMI